MISLKQIIMECVNGTIQLGPIWSGYKDIIHVAAWNTRAYVDYKTSSFEVEIATIHSRIFSMCRNTTMYN